MSEDVLDDVRSVVADVLDKGADESRGAWSTFVEAGLTALAAPEAHDGSGFGVTELAVVLDEVGRRGLDTPVWGTLVCGLGVITDCGTEEQQAALVPGIVDGSVRIAPALAEVGIGIPTTPRTSLTDGRLTGTKVRVADVVDGALLAVTATGPEGVVVAIVDPAAEGVTLTPTYASTGAVHHAVALADVTPLHVLPAGSGDRLRDLAVAGAVREGAALLAGARDLTADYIKERQQFGRVLAEFQAVAQQIADVYIDAQMVGLAAGEAIRRVAEGKEIVDDLAVAAHSFVKRAPRSLQTCHHLHGGFGVDVTYALPAYFARVIEITELLGGPTLTLAAVPAVDGEGKNGELTDSQREFKASAREYFATLYSREDKVEVLTDRHGPAYHRAIRQMGTDGWLGVGWPTEYGGKNLGVVEQQIFANEASYADVHLPSVTLQTVGPTLQQFGSEKQKEMFLSRILEGDVHFAIGYSEPDAGTDLASLRTAARQDPATGDWIVNGQKMWTTGGHAADYIWLAVRTDPDAPKHKGISILIVDTKDPGFTWTPIVTSDGSHHVNATYFNDVRVPADMLVGEVNQGWKLITSQLNHERIMLGPAGRLEGLRDRVATWAETRTAPDGTPLLEVPAVHDALAEVTEAYRVNELLNWHVALGKDTGLKAVAASSASKVFSTQEVQSLGLGLLDVVVTYGDPTDPETAWLLEYLDRTAKRNLTITFGGGVQEVQRELIAMFGLGLPKVPR
ncbi:MAG: acyl-CoA dehydrogenase [Nocardioides sp.]|uniref:acyl-CoA dehydrogenase n=1 Tax=Nocardioides sp. TaxID=35761 RepID=UPI003F0CE961